MGKVQSSLIVFLFAGATMSAQVSGRLTGTVVDQGGASIPNATVALYLQGGSTAALKTTTSSEGIFDFIGVRPDLYTLQVEGEGFAKYSQSDVKVDPARQITLPPITMAIATASQTVEITAGVTTVDTSTAEVTTTVSQAQITNLPVLNRQISNLFNTQAGSRKTIAQLR